MSETITVTYRPTFSIWDGYKKVGDYKSIDEMLKEAKLLLTPRPLDGRFSWINISLRAEWEPVK